MVVLFYGSIISLVANFALIYGLKKIQLPLISPWFVAKIIEIFMTVLVAIIILIGRVKALKLWNWSLVVSLFLIKKTSQYSIGSIIFFFPFLVYRTNMFGGWYMYSVPGGAVLKFVFDIYTWSVVKAVYLDIKFNHLREEE